MGLINAGYCDESESTQAPPVFVVAGYLCRGPDWFELARHWRAALHREGLAECGFHMSECEGHTKPPYDSMDRGERERLQRLFIGIINKAPLWGYAAGVDLTRYYEILPQIKAKRGNQAKPYFLAFEHLVERMARVLDDGRFPPGERVAFVFDRQKEYQGRAKQLYDELAAMDHLPYTRRLGSLTFEDDHACEPLQAADLWAYEIRRRLVHVHLSLGKPRWQWDLLMEGVRTNPNRGGSGLNLDWHGREQIDALARREGWIE